MNTRRWNAVRVGTAALAAGLGLSSCGRRDASPAAADGEPSPPPPAAAAIDPEGLRTVYRGAAPLADIALLPCGPEAGGPPVLIAVGAQGAILRSADGGTTWEAAAPVEPVGPDFTAVRFSTPASGWMLNRDHLLHSRDVGKTWTLAARPEGSFFYFGDISASAKQGFMIQPPTCGATVYRSANGREWTPLNGGLPRNDYNAVHFRGPQRGWVVGDYGRFAETFDGGETWTTKDFPSDAHFAELDMVSDRFGWMRAERGHGGRIWITRNGGVDWDATALGIPNYWTPVDVDFLDEATGLALIQKGVDGSRLLLSRDAGASWHPWLDVKPILTAMAFQALDEGWFTGSDGHIYRIAVPPPPPGAVVTSGVGSAAAKESAADREARMRWWREARFGMFVHWGLYSGLAGTWDGKPVAEKGGMEWIQQRVKADTKAYADRAIPLFKPSAGFAEAWAALAKAAGCRYLVFTTKHHDGFALHDSSVSDYDAGSVLGRDLVREIVEACRAAGLRVGFYHSVIDWHHDQYAYSLSKQLPHPLRGQPYPNGDRDHSVYVDYLHAQVDELISAYGVVDVLWWDYSAQDFQGDAAWRAMELMAKVRAKQPAIVMNNRLFRSPEAGWKSMGTHGFATTLDTTFGDFITPEQHIPDTGLPDLDWETCMTMNTTWGYSEHDLAWKSDAVLIRNLIDIASKGGNYLLNIGPKADGSVPEESIRAMRAIGRWMKVNGESIYATTAGPFAGLPWGRATRKGDALYLHVFDWPADGVLDVPMKADVISASLLAAPATPLDVRPDGAHTKIALPSVAPDPIATVIRLDLRGPPIPAPLPPPNTEPHRPDAAVQPPVDSAPAQPAP